MQVKLEEVSDVTKRLVIEIPAGQVNSEIGKCVNKLKHSVQLKGFRKGKVPLSVLKAKLKPKIQEEVYKSIVSETFPEALQQHNLQPISYPQFTDLHAIEEDKAFSYSAIVDVNPSVDITIYKGLEIDVIKPKPVEQLVDVEVENMRMNLAKFVPVEEKRAIEKQDFVEVDVIGKVQNQITEALSYKARVLELGKADLFAEVDDALVGMCVGDEKAVTLTVPESFYNAEFRNVEVVLELNVKQIKQRVMPDLSDDFGAQYGFKDLADLKTDIANRLRQNSEMNQRHKKQEKLLRMIIDQNPFEVPPSLCDQLLENFIFQSLNRAGAGKGGQNDEKMQRQVELLKRDPKIKADVLPIVEFQLRTDYVIRDIAKKENIEVLEEDLNRSYAEFAEQMKSSVKEVVAKITPQVKSELESRIIRDKILDFLISQANIKEIDEEVLQNPAT